MITLIDRLSDVYNKWLEENDLPDLDADDILRGSDLTDEQEEWIEEFISNWDMAQESEQIAHQVNRYITKTYEN